MAIAPVRKRRSKFVVTHDNDHSQLWMATNTGVLGPFYSIGDAADTAVNIARN